MGRPPVKSSKAVAAAQTKGRLEAETKFWDKQPLLKKLKRLMWRKLEQIDPLKMAAILATTYVVHGVILKTPEIVEKVKWYMPVTLAFGAIGLTVTGALEAAGVLDTSFKGKPMEDDMGIWIVAFIISYLLMEHGGEIAGLMLDGGKGIATLAKTILA